MAENGTATGWMSDVQRAIAMILIGSFALATLAATGRLVWSGDSAAILDMTKTLQAALVNMGLIALGFFFGSNMSKLLADAGQQKIVEKLTSSAPPATGPVAPLPAPIVVVAWWSLLTDAERAALGTSTDPRVQAFVSASQTGRASADDLAYLVNAGLLTQDRAAAIQST